MKKLTDTLILNENEIYVYFEVIRQLNAKSVLDVGMLLKRIGAISRQLKDEIIPGDTVLTGIDINGENLPINYTLYNEIISLDEYLKQRGSNNKYDLSCLLSVNEYLDRNERKALWNKVISNSKCIIGDMRNKELIDMIVRKCKAQSIVVDGEEFFIAYTE